MQCNGTSLRRAVRAEPIPEPSGLVTNPCIYERTVQAAVRLSILKTVTVRTDKETMAICDWGDLDIDDFRANDCALRENTRLLSSYSVNAHE